MEPERIFDLLTHAERMYGEKEDLLASKEGGEWRKFSAAQYRQEVDFLSFAFLYLGIQAGDKIATLTHNRPEWNFLDMAIMQVGAVHVPVYPNISVSEYQYILNHAEVRLVFVAGEELHRKISSILPDCPSIMDVFTFRKFPGLKCYLDLVETGKSHPNPIMLKERIDAVTADDVATIIYTSGTTGFPKGVMLSHYNILSNTYAVSPVPDKVCDCNTLVLSFLPLCHVYERMLGYMYQYKGWRIYYAESMGTISENIKELRPNFMCTVPRLLEKVYDKILMTGQKLTGVKRYIFYWSVNLALAYKESGNGLWFRVQQRVADKLVYSKWREALGGRFNLIVSGGAALQPRIAASFSCAGIRILEGYGLTESSPVIAVSTLEKGGIKFGTVGPPLPNTKVKIADDGEILAKGPGIMIGYYKDPENTALTIDKEGWLHTGDMGIIEKGGQLRITGRKKDLFKTSMGKYVAPHLIQEKLKESPFIENVIVVGENQKFAAALIIPDFNHLKAWCDFKGVEFISNETAINNKTIILRLRKEVDRINQTLSEAEKVKSFALIADEWTVESGDLTPTLKLKREIIQKKYYKTIQGLFE